MELILGGIYKAYFSENPVRVIAFDDIEVHYDSFWPSLNQWTFASSLRRGAVYYRMPKELFLKDIQFVQEQELTDAEFNTFRPDLPFRMCRHKQLSWTDKVFDTHKDYQEHLTQLGIVVSDEIILPVPSITLTPFGARGRVTALKSISVTALNKEGFTESELLWLANNIQAEHAKHISDIGVGLYRSGHEKKMPSYYIFGFYDMADNVPKEA